MRAKKQSSRTLISLDQQLWPGRTDSDSRQMGPLSSKDPVFPQNLGGQIFRELDQFKLLLASNVPLIQIDDEASEVPANLRCTIAQRPRSKSSLTRVKSSIVLNSSPAPIMLLTSCSEVSIGRTHRFAVRSAAGLHD
ncbi:MAG: hypothetical protein EOO27_32535 [Comamonadaceae bacterium]|nr:MAG: hypothetical protein EOO27_32535 [Comamonadaceae bacterium]